MAEAGEWATPGGSPVPPVIYGWVFTKMFRGREGANRAWGVPGSG